MFAILQDVFAILQTYIAFLYVCYMFANLQKMTRLR